MGIPCAWHPTPTRKANAIHAGSATNHTQHLSTQTIVLTAASMGLCALAAMIEGGTFMVAAFAIHLAAHIVIVIGCRAEGIAVFME